MNINDTQRLDWVIKHLLNLKQYKEQVLKDFREIIDKQIEQEQNVR